VTVRDDPWRRLPWILPSAALLTLALLFGFLRLLAEEDDHHAPLPPPIDVGLIEMPAPASPTAPFPPAATDTAPQPGIAPPSPPLETPPTPAEEEPVPAAEAPPSPPPPPPPAQPKAAPRLAPKPAKPRPAAPAAERAAPAAPSTASPPPAAEVPPAATNALGLGNMGARVIYKPLPELPAALRRRGLELVAVARFRVATDGSAAVELIEPTNDPELNRALLEKLRTWRFFPAMEQGRPVASSLDIRIPISVQ
jgi:periplasmic protein TonB